MSTFLEMTPAALRRHRETVLLRLLIRVQQAETNELVRRLHEMGHGTVQPAWIGVLGNVDTEGTRVSTIAERTGRSKQATGQLLNGIERAGFVQKMADNSDGRAVLVGHTTSGRRLLADALAAMADIEAGYEAILGPTRMRTLKKTLADLSAAADAVGQLGPG